MVPRPPHPTARAAALAALAAVLAAGCGTTRQTDSARSATEMLLVSRAIDRAVGQLDFSVLRGKTVFFDAQYVEAAADKGYLVSSLRQHLLAHGCLLQEDRAQAAYVVEVRTGGLGTDRHSLLVGVPQMNVPQIVPGQPSMIPEIPFAKKTDQEGVAKIAVFAYERTTGKAVWQSGTLQAWATAKDTWVLGAGPFRSGSIIHGTEFAGVRLPLPGDDEKDQPAPGVPPLTKMVVWTEPSATAPTLLPPDLIAGPMPPDAGVRQASAPAAVPKAVAK